MDLDALAERIRTFLEEELGVDRSQVTHEAQLVTTGLVDSAGMVRLAVLIEEEMGIVIPDRDIHADHFDSLAKIEAYLRRKSGA
jgi:acyl carrier protein